MLRNGSLDCDLPSTALFYTNQVSVTIISLYDIALKMLPHHRKAISYQVLVQMLIDATTLIHSKYKSIVKGERSQAIGFSHAT